MGKRIKYPDISGTTSFTETTGIMARMPMDEDEYEAEQDMYGMEIPREWDE